jgi:hypothetical protein
MSNSGTEVANLINLSFKKFEDPPFEAAALPNQKNCCGSSFVKQTARNQAHVLAQQQPKSLFCSFHVFLASNSTSGGATEQVEAIAFSNSRFFRPPKCSSCSVSPAIQAWADASPK